MTSDPADPVAAVRVPRLQKDQDDEGTRVGPFGGGSRQDLSRRGHRSHVTAAKRTDR